MSMKEEGEGLWGPPWATALHQLQSLCPKVTKRRRIPAGTSEPVCHTHPFTAGTQALPSVVCFNRKERPSDSWSFCFPLVSCDLVLSHVTQCPGSSRRQAGLHMVPYVLPWVSDHLQSRRGVGMNSRCLAPPFPSQNRGLSLCVSKVTRLL